MRRRPEFFAGCLIVLAALLAYGDSFPGPLVDDDITSISANQTIRDLASIGAVLSPPAEAGQTVGGRPMVNLSFAVNYAISGTKVWSYHAVNLLIHILAGLTLFGIMRRTLEGIESSRSRKTLATGPTGQPASQNLTISATGTAFAVALLWTIHPLQTEAVTYIVQRAESLMGLFYLLTLYGFIRGADREVGRVILNPPENMDEHGRSERRIKDNPPYRWYTLSFLACLLGMATKEVMVSAPVIVLLYDVAFISGSFREAWRRHGRLHAGLAATWLLLGYLVLTTGQRGESMGFHVGIGWGAYFLTQFPAVALYLRLAVWPHPLIFDYGAEWVTDAWRVIPSAALVTALAAGTVYLWWRRPRLGFLGICFFALLAPTSLVPGIRQTIAEHRMYLPLAAVLAALVCGLHAALQRVAPRRAFFIGSTFLICAAVAGGALAARRNETYRTDLALWGDTVAKRPKNAHAHDSLGQALAVRGRMGEAENEFREALRRDPSRPDARSNLATALLLRGAVDEAIEEYRQTLRVAPKFEGAHYDLGLALARAGRMEEAIGEYAEAVRLQPDLVAARYNLANGLVDAGRPAEAAEQYQALLRLRPDDADARINYANTLLRLHRQPEAIAQYEAALKLQPESAELHNAVGILLAEAGRPDEARAHFQRALALRPDWAAVRDNLERIDAARENAPSP